MIEFSLWNNLNEQTACTEGVNELEALCEADQQVTTFVADDSGEM